MKARVGAELEEPGVYSFFFFFLQNMGLDLFLEFPEDLEESILYYMSVPESSDHDWGFYRSLFRLTIKLMLMMTHYMNILRNLMSIESTSFSNLFILVRMEITLPVSSVTCEKSFSAVQG